MAKPFFACHAAFLCPFEMGKRKNRKFPPVHVYHFDAVWQRNLKLEKNANDKDKIPNFYMGNI